MSLLNRPIGKAANKPQNKISDSVKRKAIKEFGDWFEASSGVSGYTSGLLAENLIEKVIRERVKATSPTAADVLLADARKIEQLVSKAQEMAAQLDAENKLEKLLDDLYNAHEHEANC